MGEKSLFLAFPRQKSKSSLNPPSFIVDLKISPFLFLPAEWLFSLADHSQTSLADQRRPKRAKIKPGSQNEVMARDFKSENCKCKLAFYVFDHLNFTLTSLVGMRLQCQQGAPPRPRLLLELLLLLAESSIS